MQHTMDHPGFKQLLDKYLTHSIHPGERKQFFEMLRSHEHNAELETIIDDQLAAGHFVDSENDELRQIIFQKIQERKNKTSKLRHIGWRRMIAAAAAVVVLGLSLWFFVGRKTTGDVPQDKIVQNDVAPGRSKAVLTLADGTTIILDSAASGELTKQGNIAVLNKDGQLVYESGVGSRESEVLFNSLSTAKGETYSLTLADGSKVWLNSASSVRFPVVFIGKERRIEITGEAYFDVAKNTNQPFIVSVNGIEVQALGTEFNINAYQDEDIIATTLIEGSVKVSKPAINESVVIKPGQQARISENSLSLASISVEEVVAWKQGQFHFESADLKTILRQFSRWYDVEIIYEGPIKNRKFFGIVSRNSTLANVLKMLQANDIKFRIEGKKLYVVSG